MREWALQVKGITSYPEFIHPSSLLTNDPSHFWFVYFSKSACDHEADFAHQNARIEQLERALDFAKNENSALLKEKETYRKRVERLEAQIQSTMSSPGRVILLLSFL